MMSYIFFDFELSLLLSVKGLFFFLPGIVYLFLHNQLNELL